MGHEFVGEVVEVGGDVTGLAVGDRVTASPIVPCMECARCKEGRYNLCAVCWSTAIAYGRPGGFAELRSRSRPRSWERTSSPSAPR